MNTRTINNTEITRKTVKHDILMFITRKYYIESNNSQRLSHNKHTPNSPWQQVYKITLRTLLNLTAFARTNSQCFSHNKHISTLRGLQLTIFF